MFTEQFNLRTGNPLSHDGRKNCFLLRGLQTHGLTYYRITLTYYITDAT